MLQSMSLYKLSFPFPRLRGEAAVASSIAR
jgi:hypothetical protein